MLGLHRALAANSITAAALRHSRARLRLAILRGGAAPGWGERAFCRSASGMRMPLARRRLKARDGMESGSVAFMREPKDAVQRMGRWSLSSRRWPLPLRAGVMAFVAREPRNNGAYDYQNHGHP